MKIQMLVISVIGLSLTCTTWADDLPQMGYEAGIPVEDLVARGYRWVEGVPFEHTLYRLISARTCFASRDRAPGRSVRRDLLFR
jgi:hypothetical protein